MKIFRIENFQKLLISLTKMLCFFLNISQDFGSKFKNLLMYRHISWYFRYQIHEAVHVLTLYGRMSASVTKTNLDRTFSSFEPDSHQEAFILRRSRPCQSILGMILRRHRWCTFFQGFFHDEATLL